ncbi:DUF4924 family protein [Belliella pelovolcani]|jgi:hypothetical protein|uniref:DUF4924 domain-containing protein n=1 Tax=Belliella pelovolcani TaxID=529505 RepID=A0A1N7P7S5_9BACT|nr:DUF4924 family protein [Belliella pelovolcani]SIT06578.1 protein of unknown function [Belliella pelovolcani]
MKAVAEKKRSQNIPEYIIYMYQMEDLIRAYECNLEDIKQYVVNHYPISSEEKEATAAWFSDLIELMKAEEITAKGHLNIIQAQVDLLAQTHWQLLKEDQAYFNIYNQAKPHIIQMIMDAEGVAIGHEIQICLNGIYGLLLAKLKGREIPKIYQEATEAFGAVLSYLNSYLQIKTQ